MMTQDRFTMTAALAAAFNILVLMVICFYVGPMGATDKTVEVVIGASDKTLETMERIRAEERSDRREERAADREAMRKTWESLKEIRAAVDRNTTAMNEMTQALRVTGIR